MADEIKTGTVLLKEGALLPEALQIESELCVRGWRLVKDLNGYALDRKVHEAGWTFFFLAGEIRTIALGANEQSTVRRAIKRILANPRSKQCNSLEITRVASKRFLGLLYVSVGAHSRHIQEGLILFSAERTPGAGGTRLTTQGKASRFTSARALAPEGTSRQVGVATAQSL
jgi:hypothetical protein